MSIAHETHLPATNAEGFDLIAAYLSPHKARAFQTVGMNLVQGPARGRAGVGPRRP